MESERMCFIVRKISRRAVLLLGGALTLTALTDCWPNGGSSSEQTKKAVGATLKAAATAKNYDVEINDDLSQRATAILQEYVRERNTLYDVTDDEASPVEIYLEDNESYGTIVFVMPEKASVPQTWTKACELFVEELWHYTYGENQAEIGIDIARQVSVNGDEPVDCMIIFAKRHYGVSGGDIDTPPIL